MILKNKEKFLGFLGLTRKSGNLVLGGNLTQTAINKNRIKLIVLAEDASSNTKEKFLREAENLGIKIITFPNKEDLGSVFGKSEISVLGVTDIKMAKRIISLSDESLLNDI